MTDVQIRGGKYCPRCSTMARQDADQCAHCGHRFSTGFAATAAEDLHTPMTEAELNRTRMFTLPPFVPRAPVSAENPSDTILSPEEVAELERSLAAGRRAGWNWAYAAFALVALLAGGFLWWLLGHL